MGFLIGFLTFILVLDCLVLILLVIVQLPKKDAGVGMAFGGGAADALFGAGSGTVLTKITKYAAGILFGLAIVLALMQNSYSNRSRSEFERQVEQGGKQPAPVQTAPPESAPTVTTPAASTNLLLSVPASAPATPAPAEK